MSNRVSCEKSDLQRIPEQLAAKKTSGDGHFFQAVDEWLKQAGGAFDVMNAFNRVCKFFGNDHLKAKAEGYLDVAAVPRLPSVAISMIQRLNSARSEKKTLPVVTDVSHQIFDVGATACYAWAVFAQRRQPVLYKTAAVFDVLSDVTDFGTCSFRCWDYQKKLAQIKTAPPLIQQAICNEWRDSQINMIRVVTAIATSIFACCLVLTGTALVPAMAAVTIAIANSIFTILAYYHKNYWCNVQLTIG